MKSNSKKVVITGLGVVAPNAITVPDFHKALYKGVSGIKHQKELAELSFGCTIAGQPHISEEKYADYFTDLQLRGLQATGIIYGVIAGKDALRDAGIEPATSDKPHEDLGIIMGTGQSGSHKFREAIHHIDNLKVRRLGSTSVIQTMNSGVSAWLAGEIGAGNIVTSNSSACSTGTEALLMGYERIKNGDATQMLVGSTSDSGPYIWGGFDAMRILPTNYNENPTQASRPLSANACGFVPGSGAGALLLESKETAVKRGAKIYAEVLGGMINSGGQRAGGTMTAPNGTAVQQCIKRALQKTGIEPCDIDTINGHLTATAKDSFEIKNWKESLMLEPKDFPTINSFKSTIGHCLAAAGSIELVGSVLQIHHQVVYPNVNLNPLHPEIQQMIPEKVFPTEPRDQKIKYLMKSSFGFGDVNAVVILKKSD